MFISRCLVMDQVPEIQERVSSEILSGRVIWEDFVWMGSSHYVLPALYSSFRRNGLLPLLPEDLTAHLEHIYSLNYQRNLGILDQCREINARLTPMGIEILFLKGAGMLLSGLYHDLGDRIMGDIDILIPDKDLPEASECLSDLGYVPAVTGPEAEIYENFHHLPPLVCKGKAAPLEVHRLPVLRKYACQIPVQTLFQNKVPDREKTCWLPSVTDRQLIVFFHEYLSTEGYLSTTPSLKEMYDFYLLARQGAPDPLILQPGRYRKRYIRFLYLTGKFTDGTEQSAFQETPSLRRLWKREVFLLNNPGVNRFWHDYIFTPVYLGGLIIKSIYSGKSRRLILFKLKKRMQMK